MRAKTRREFLTTAVAGAALGVKGSSPSMFAAPAGAAGLAVLGGQPVRTAPFPDWPKIAENDEASWAAVLRKKEWCRLDAKPSYVTRFEETWKAMTGAKYCVGTSSGTAALLTSLNALEIGAGDEVLVPPYTFVATINVVLMQNALPIFVDSDSETFQMDANKAEAAVTTQTRCILPVHLGGSVVNMDKIMEVAGKHNLPVLEDACQSHLAEWKHQSVGLVGTMGCFSFQASKNLNCGEGGAILSNDRELIERCMSFHNAGRSVTADGYGDAYVRNGSNHRMTEFQGALLVTQASRLEAQSRTRTANATYLSKLLGEIPGISPAKMYPGCTRNAYHLYMFRYDKDHFQGLPRERFLKALEAEGVPCDGGYDPLNKQEFIEATLKSRAFRRIYTEQELAHYRERNHCPENDRLCEEAVWFSQTMLLGTRQDMDQIAEAVRKIQQHAGELLRS